MNPQQSKLKYEFGLVGVALIWGVNFPVVKSALGMVGPLTFNAYRFSLSGLFLGLLYLRERHKTRARDPISFPWWYVIGLGLLGHFAYQLFFILGIDHTTAGNSAFLISSAPLWTALVGKFSGHERLTTASWFGLGIAFLGAATLVIGHSGIDLSGSRTLGNLLSLGGAAAWGSFTALSRPALRDHSPTGLAFWTMLPAIPLLWIASWLEPSESGWMALPTVWGAIVYSGMLSVGVAYIIWNASIRKVGASHTAVYANMVPVTALAVGVVWLGEAVTVVDGIGSLLILSGLYLMRRR